MANVLIVEDEVVLSHLYVRLFSLSMYNVKVISTGKDIAEMITSFRPDVILLDIYLRNEDGRDICKKIKQNLTAIPVILVSTSNELKEMCEACGADDYIEKPFDINDMMNKVSKWTKIYEQSKIKSTDNFHYFHPVK